MRRNALILWRLGLLAGLVAGRGAETEYEEGPGVGWADITDGARHIGLWEADPGRPYLGTLGRSTSQGFDLNETGSVVGSARVVGGGNHAFHGEADTGLPDVGYLGQGYIVTAALTVLFVGWLGVLIGVLIFGSRPSHRRQRRKRILRSKEHQHVPDTAISRAPPPGEPTPTDAALSRTDTTDEKERLTASTDHAAEAEVPTRQ